ncbi:maternal effect embryo arrest protein [Rhynchospora pubera]|uniref:Maternal effect embryo arrest protein n=1 Tax=Rhynchospora pubera TaxID=906938 RepID=A0AAV8GS56_9POAL|nr:maternal effect embryo arrest protein [Rhynchospora pubera]
MDEFEEEHHNKTHSNHSDSLHNDSKTSIHVTALDGVVNVNSLFTVAVFVGLSLTAPGQQSLTDNHTECDAGPDVIRNLLVFEVVSFSFFLFSSLVAQGLKLAINLINSKDPHDAVRAHINTKILHLGMLASAVGSVLGCIFLLLSMVDVVQIRLGMLSCGSHAAVRAVAGLIGLVSTALAVYVCTVFYAFTH